MKSSTLGFSGLMQRWALGIALGLVVSGCATTNPAASKVADVTVKKASQSVKQQNRQARKNTTQSRQAYYLMPDNLGKKNLSSGQTGRPVTTMQAQQSRPQPAVKTTAPDQVGTASYYGKSFQGKKTASGERFDQNDYTCAHGSLPFGCRLRVTNLRNNKSVEVKVNDRGGFQKHGRVIDLSKAAAKEIGMLSSGTAKVQIEVLE